MLPSDKFFENLELRNVVWESSNKKKCLIEVFNKKSGKKYIQISKITSNENEYIENLNKFSKINGKININLFIKTLKKKKKNK